MPSLLDQHGNPLSRAAPSYDVQPLRSRSDTPTEQWVDKPTGFQIKHYQKCDDTVRAVHDAAELLPKKTKGDGVRYTGSVPVVLALVWAKECGMPVGTKEWIAYADKKMKGEFSKLRVRR